VSAALFLAACGTSSPLVDVDGSNAAAGPRSADATTDTGIDATLVDAGVGETRVSDAGIIGAGIADASIADSGMADAGVADAGVADAGVANAGMADASVADASVAQDAGADSGPPDATGPLVSNVVTQHNDNARTGANLAETTLTVGNVRPSTFGKLFARAVDDQTYAQPLLVSQVSIPGQGIHNVLYIATMNDSVYAFDADARNQGTPLWQTSFLDVDAGVVPVTRADVGLQCVFTNISGNIGIESTPVIDPVAGRMFVVAKTKNQSGAQTYTLHALDITTGLDQLSPVVVAPSVPGTGAGSTGTMIAFDASVENQRGSLLLANGKVYVTFGGYCESGNYHGWILAYDAATLSLDATFASTPNGIGGGIWMSGQGAAADSAGNVYVVASGGTTDVTTGGSDYAEALLELTPSLAVSDWFVPFDYATLSSSGNFYGSAGVLLVPETTLAITGSETSKVYVNDTTALGHWNSANDSQIVQSLQLGGSEVHGSPVTMNGMVFVWAAGDTLRSYQVSGGLLTPAQTGPATLSTGDPGGILSLSSSGAAAGTGILWVSQPASGDASQATVPGILQAYDASSLATEIWDSHLTAGDDCGAFAKFASPTVANGKVYLPSFANQVCVYGLNQ